MLEAVLLIMADVNVVIVFLVLVGNRTVEPTVWTVEVTESEINSV